MTFGSLGCRESAEFRADPDGDGSGDGSGEDEADFLDF